MSLGESVRMAHCELEIMCTKHGTNLSISKGKAIVRASCIEKHEHRGSLGETVRMPHCELEIMGTKRRTKLSISRGKAIVRASCIEKYEHIHRTSNIVTIKLQKIPTAKNLLTITNLPSTNAVRAVVPEELLIVQSFANARSALRNDFRIELSTSSKKALSTCEAWGKLASSNKNLIACLLM